MKFVPDQGEQDQAVESKFSGSIEVKTQGIEFRNSEPSH